MLQSLLSTVGVLLVTQVTQATVAGTVRDEETAAPLPGAVVALADLDRMTVTGVDGRYVMPHVPAGPQHVTVRAVGYSPRLLHALVPREGTLEVDVSLRSEPIRLQTLDVRAPVLVRGLEGGRRSAFPGREISLAAARNHPMLEEPDGILALGGGEVVLRPETPNGVHIRGGASDQTAYLLDGVPVFTPFHAAGLSGAWNPDALSRMSLTSSGAPAARPHSLSGTIEGVTRPAGDRFRGRGGVSTTQARLTVDGPLAVGAGYVLSLRSGLPGALAPKGEGSYVRGETGDRLGKLEAPLLGGRGRLLGYDSENEIEAAAEVSPEDGPGPDAGRNHFRWQSRSLGAEWTRDVHGAALRVLGWSAGGDAGSVWADSGRRSDLAASRSDAGILAVVERGSGPDNSLAGIRLERSRTSYGVASDSGSFGLWARTPVATLFAQHARTVGAGVELELGASLAAAAGGWHPSPRAQLRWAPSEHVALSGSYARAHQFVQSLRNPESVVGNVFPVDLHMGAGASGVPVARSDLGVAAVEYRPSAGMRVGLQVYARGSRGLVLVAPREGQPFSSGRFLVGSGSARGASVDAALSAARWGIVVSYGLQRVRLEHADSSYVPEHGATHLLEGGVTTFPSATTSVRLCAAAAFGRRSTTAVGGFEWEAYNLLDRGAEFGGSPRYDGQALGATPLPAYFRVDLGLRKHWHVHVAGRDATLALFGTVTNLLGRKNVLTYARHPSTGDLVAIEMRPRAPLVVGLDWQF